MGEKERCQGRAGKAKNAECSSARPTLPGRDATKAPLRLLDTPPPPAPLPPHPLLPHHNINTPRLSVTRRAGPTTCPYQTTRHPHRENTIYTPTTHPNPTP